MAIDDATARQVRASDPGSSTWLSANAGSGKTRVLTDRVARLLLQDVEPQRILCLTYTKSAASEMQNRLFKTLGAWAMMPAPALREALAALGEARLDADHLARARRRFARAIETPGGLRIQTIHSFCATLLRRFPLEAGVSPRFAELDDRSARLVRQEIVEEMADGLAAVAMAGVAAEFTGADFRGLVEQVVAKRGSFGPFRADLDFAAEEAAIVQGVFLGGEAEWMGAVLVALAVGKASDHKAFAALSALNLSAPDLELLVALEEVFLFGEKAAAPFGAKIGAFPTKDVRAALGATLARLEDLMQRVEAARPRRIALLADRKTAALNAFAGVFLPLYEDRKARHGWLDFDDLILRATALLTDPSVAAWVLYRLDGGIDHVLVDEAQDTGPGQWRVIELLTAEFAAGESARTVPRTVFVVGDQKQSIYSFQGADVAAFEDKHAAFRTQITQSNRPFQSLKLEHSFRSSPAILTFVDAALKDRDAAALGAEIAHIAFKDRLPGRVDLWPAIESVKDPVDTNFDDPVDLISTTHHVAQLAEKVAEAIDSMISAGTAIVTASGVRAVHAGDFLILVQSRSPLFTEIIRACKKRGLPIAGADRLKLGAELAVKDLLALLAFLDTPDDDLSLAAVLRSPLYGVTDGELFDLAYGRKGSLWQALVAKQGLFADTVTLLTDLREQVDFLRPYDLLERVLVQQDGRRRLVARLGDEAEDGIDELLNQTLAYERADVPSLTGFLIWLDAESIDIKRQAEASGQRIRVMTVHGAKGLESEIVILPDTADRKPQDRDEIYLDADGHALWKVSASESPPHIATLRADKQRREAEENLRLLYVAMTRARTWLIIAAAGAVTKPASWYAIAAEGMNRVGAEARYETGDWPAPHGQPATSVAVDPAPAPWASFAVPQVAPVPDLVTPSDLGGAKALPGEATVDATLRGDAVHLLLQHLPARPATDWASLAAHLVPDPDLCASVWPEVQAVLIAAPLAPLFAADTLAEVALTAALGDRRLFGVIDRLVIGPDVVLAVDFKSNAVVPDHPLATPEGLLRQLGAYHHALGQIYPDRRIEVAIVWTRTAQLMPISADIVRAALACDTMDGVMCP